MNAAQMEIYSKAVNAMAAMAATRQGSGPLLYGPDSRPIRPTPGYGYSRTAAKRAGSMKNWVPQRIVGRASEAMEREKIVERSIDLTNNDPHASGVVDSFAVTVVGPGLTPHPMLDPKILGIDKKEVRRIQSEQWSVYQTWAPFADAGGRMTFGAIQFLLQRNLIEFGEYVVLLPMIDDPLRPYSLACQVIHPLRLKTPVDKMNDPSIRDGVELGEYGEAVAYWIKKSDPRGILSVTPDISANFLRIPARVGHRWNVLHGFIATEPEQVRGIPFMAPAMKIFRDLNDYLDAELVSNIVTAAFALFIEQPDGTDPYGIAEALAGMTETETGSDGTAKKTRYQEWVPGQILYGNAGEKPAPIAASRPGVTFEPFTKVIKKAISMALGMPYPVLFKDAEGTSFAGFRSAMLDAWRVYMHRRIWLGQTFCQPVYTMLMEEAYLRGSLVVADFYTRMMQVTRSEWRGTPKGDIEPVKAAQADILLNQNNMKPKAEIIAERGGDARTTFDQLEEEQEMMAERGLVDGPTPQVSEKDDEDDEAKGAVDDMEGAGQGLEQS